jgi:flagellar basal-body rod protein FlgG
VLEGLYSAAAGMAAQQERMNALAGDLANVNTPGYKRQRVTFRDLAYQEAGRGALAGVRTGTGAAAVYAGRGQAQGALRRTDEPFDLAILGQGFFRVRRPEGGVALTRDGSFHRDSLGRLTTSNGAILEGVRIPRGVNSDDVRVSPNGRVTANGRNLGRIDVVTVRNPDGLAAAGDNLFTTTALSGPVQNRGGRIEQGVLEQSNVDLADAMVDLIDAQRSYQLASRAIQVQDQMMEVANGVKK